jgi:hypothetical protein
LDSSAHAPAPDYEQHLEGTFKVAPRDNAPKRKYNFYISILSELAIKRNLVVQKRMPVTNAIVLVSKPSYCGRF